MNIDLKLSEEKLEMLGKIIAYTFKMKKNKNGFFPTCYQGEKSAKGIASIIIATLEETIDSSEEELKKCLKENFDIPL